jgi:hypothetical protein
MINTSSSQKTINQFYINLYDSNNNTFSLNDKYEIYCSTEVAVKSFARLVDAASKLTRIQPRLGSRPL